MLNIYQLNEMKLVNIYVLIVKEYLVLQDRLGDIWSIAMSIH